MCGRFFLTLSPADLAGLFKAASDPALAAAPELEAPRYNIRPTDRKSVV